jgi:hypothetical protein
LIITFVILLVICPQLYIIISRIEQQHYIIGEYWSNRYIYTQIYLLVFIRKKTEELWKDSFVVADYIILNQCNLSFIVFFNMTNTNDKINLRLFFVEKFYFYRPSSFIFILVYLFFIIWNMINISMDVITLGRCHKSILYIWIES